MKCLITRFIGQRQYNFTLQDVSRTEKLNIRLTKQEKQDIEYCSGKLNLSRTDTIIKGIGLVKKEIEK